MVFFRVGGIRPDRQGMHHPYAWVRMVIESGRHRPDSIQKEPFSGMGETEKDILGREEQAESVRM